MSKEPQKISAGGVKKGRNAGEKVVTANRLLDGVVIYATPDAEWTEELSLAAVVEGDEAMAFLAKMVADEGNSVGPYLMDVEIGADGLQPSGRALLRETIRDQGPTIHPQFGRQSGAQDLFQEEKVRVSV